MMDIDLSTLTPRSILVCQLKQIGDVVISTAMVELLARRYPEAEIHFLTEARSAPILENNPHLTQVWKVDKTRNLLADFAFTRRVARHGFDLLVDFQQLPRTRRIAILSPAPVRLSIRSKWYKQFPYTHLVEMRKGGYAGRFKAQLLAPL
ncbi:MAG: glycosyltransferase family 9 protein, partial [Proteobacteria bacterium]|nr:glycosyltransferase family 9 protein [Pseudomonadota bacterium]